MTVKELYELFKDFKNNDFHDLKDKVDRNTWFIAVGVGIIVATQILIKIFL